MAGWRIIKIGIVVWMLWATQLIAQPPRFIAQPPRPEERGGREQFFDAMREAHHQLSSSREPLELLWHESVRQEIGLSEENYNQIVEWRRESFKALRELSDELKDQEFGKEALVQKILENQAPVDEKIFKLLHKEDVADMDRLVEIYVQAQGYRAVINETVARHIKLEGDELEAYRRARGEIWRRLMHENRERVGKMIREGNRDKISHLFEEAEKKVNVALAARLTDQQRAALKQLEGEKFDVPKPAFEFRGPPRGRRGNENRGDDKHGDPKQDCCSEKKHPR